MSDGGSAFPSPGVVLSGGRQQGAYEGMTLRDYFAAVALQGFLVGGRITEQSVYKAAYLAADGMLKARSE